MDGAWTCSDGWTTPIDVWISDCERTSDGGRFVGVHGHDFSRSGGARNEAEARRLTELGLAFYSLLRSAPPFRSAAVGAEVVGFCDYPDLARPQREIPRGYVHYDEIPGIVVCDAAWNAMEQPSSMVVFAEGYHWNPWHGEDLARYGLSLDQFRPATLRRSR